MSKSYPIDYKHFDAEIQECRKDISQFHSGRREFNNKITNILTRKSAGDKLTEYNNTKDIPAQTPYNQSKLPNDLSYYKKNPTDSIQTATANCISNLAETTQLSQADRTKACQQLAAKSGKGANHLSRSASVQEVPAWLLTYDYVNNKGAYEEPITNSSNVRSASIEEPAWAVTSNHSPMNRSLLPIEQAEHKSTNIKSGNIKDTRPAWMTCYDYVNNKDMA